MKHGLVTVVLLALLAPAAPAQSRLVEPGARFAAPLLELEHVLGPELATYEIRLLVGLERDHILIAPDVVVGVRPLLVLDPRAIPAVEELERLLTEHRLTVFVQGLAWRDRPNTPRPVLASSVYRLAPLGEDPPPPVLHLLATDSIPPHQHLHASLEVPSSGHELQVTRIEATETGMRVDLLLVQPGGPVLPVVETVRAFADLGTKAGANVEVWFAHNVEKGPLEYRLVAVIPID